MERLVHRRPSAPRNSVNVGEVHEQTPSSSDRNRDSACGGHLVKRLRSASFGAVLLVGTIALAGCSGPSSPSPSQPRSESPSASLRSSEGGATPDVDDQAIPLPGRGPLQEYFLAPEEFATVNQAEDVLVGQCMDTFGFDYAVPDFASRLAHVRAAEAQGDSRLFGVTDPAQVRRFGLGVDVSDEAGGDETPSVVDEPSGAYLLVFTGSRSGSPPDGSEESPGVVDGVEIPAGGCLGQARRALSGSVVGIAQQLGRSTWVEAGAEAEGDPRYRDVVGAWTSCMADKGYRVTSLLDDKGEASKFTRDWASTQPSKAEVEFALTDIECKKSVDLVPRLSKIFADHQRRAIDRNQLALFEEKKRIEAMVKRAATVVKRGAE